MKLFKLQPVNGSLLWNKCTNDYANSIIIINNNNKCNQKLLSQYKTELSVSDIKKKQFKLE